MYLQSFKLPKCYKSIFRPQLEYASTKWDPVKISSIAKLESVQRRAARFCCKNITSMMQELCWEDLQLRRGQSKVTMMLRIANKLDEIPAGQFRTATGVATRRHQQRFLPIHCSINHWPSKQRFSTNSLPLECSACLYHISTNF